MKTLKIFFCIILISLLLCSCNESQRINDLTIVQGFGIDEKQGETEISLQFLNLFANSGSTEQLQGNITGVANGKSKNISDAVAAASKSISNDIFFGQNKIIIFGMDYAKSNIDSAVDYLLRSNDSRPDVIAAISKTTAKDVIKSKERGAKIPAENVYNLLKLGEKNGLGCAVTVADLLNLYNDKTSDIFLPVLKAEENAVSCEGIAIFSNSEYKKTLSEEQTFGFLFVKDKIESGVLTVESEGLGEVGLVISGSKSFKSVEINGSDMTFNIKVDTKLIINEIENGINNPISEMDLKEVQSKAESKIKKLCEDAVKACFAEKSDPFMCARYVYLKDVDVYNANKESWRDKLSDIDVKCEASSSIQRINDNSSQ